MKTNPNRKSLPLTLAALGLLTLCTLPAAAQETEDPHAGHESVAEAAPAPTPAKDPHAGHDM